MTDPVSPREALIERLVALATFAMDEEDSALLRDAADALAADEALRAENEALRAVLLSNEHIEKNTLRTSWQEAEAMQDAAVAAAENCECPHDPDGTCAAPREIAAAEARAVAAEERIEAVRVLHVPVETWCEAATSEDGEWTERAMYDSDGTLVAAVDGVQVVCAVCAPRYGVPSPCPTVAALGAPLDPKEAQR